jgi:carboxyl-terminal processing protease
MTRHWKSRRWLVLLAMAGLSVTVTGAAIGQAHPGAESTRTAAGQPPCTAPSSPGPPPLTPTTAGTIEQAYYCVFAHYYNAGALDDRPLLNGAFAGLTQELDRLRLDQADATAPPLSGNRDKDWAAFAAAYQRVINRLPADATVRQAVAAATMTAMLNSLNDNHAGWQHSILPRAYQPGDIYGIGISTSPSGPLFGGAPAEALPPLFITSVLGGPAAAQRLRPGDVIEAVNGQSPFAGGVPSPGVGNLLSQTYPNSDPVRLTLHRPASGRTWTVTLKPALYRPTAKASQAVTARFLSHHIAYVRMQAFAPGAADAALNSITDLGKRGKPRGIVLDLRGNGGGSPQEVARLLGAFTHGKTWSYDCDTPDHCDTANQTDDTVPLLHLPLVVLTDRNCASACDAFSGAVKDLHLGNLVGTRTAGVVAGPAAEWLLDDGSLLSLPSRHELGADHETINGIGVAPDYYLPTTPRDLSTGHDADIAMALALLERRQTPPTLASTAHRPGQSPARTSGL